MNDHRHHHHRPRHAGGVELLAGAEGTRLVFGACWALLGVASILVTAPWAGFHGVLLGGVGLLMVLRPPVFALPRLWWALAAVFVIAGAAAFLPVSWFGMPEWRRGLESLGVATGPLVAIQWRQALETHVLFAVMLLVGLWLAGHRSSSAQIRSWTLAFAAGVACYAILARVMQNWEIMNSPLPAGRAEASAHFGFFPNRNHTATYLAMGSICGLGSILQAIRDKRFVALGCALAATGVCLWAVIAWSVSRGGVLLVAVGCLVWLAMLGRRYLGRNGLRALGLIALTVIGLFFTVDGAVKERMAKTVEKASEVIGAADPATAGDDKPAVEATAGLDFRIPTMLDTLGLIRDFKWTGTGAGQFYRVFPQYRQRTALANDSDSYHPESDWLWLASEAGIPAALALACLACLAFLAAWGEIRQGRERALRSACLVAALLVPFHGLFDVPGHRITLAWSAALLYALSRPVPSAELLPSPPRAWPFRLAAGGILAAAVWLILAQWHLVPQPALTTAKAAVEVARRLVREDQALRQAAHDKGEGYQPSRAEDRLEQALTVIDRATPLAPLDRDLLRYQAMLAFPFDDKFERIEHAFAAERALDPTWVGGPLLQAAAWSTIRPEKTAALWSEALARAGKIDQIQPGSQWSRDRTMEKIREAARGKPALEKLLPAASE